MSSGQITSRRMAEEKLVQLAAQDDAFRKQLVTDPKTTISRALGIRLPSDITINVLEETDQILYFVLPANLASPELAEHELAAVACGTEAAAATLNMKSE